MAKTRAQLNREVRQEALRDQLEAQGHVQHVVEIAGKLRDLKNDLESQQVTRLKSAADLHLKLIDKYLPSLQSTTIDQTIEHLVRAQELSDDALADIATGSSTGTTEQAKSQNSVH